MKIKSNNTLIQFYAIISGLILIYYGFTLNNPLLLFGGITIMYRDIYLSIKNEKCIKSNKMELNFDIRSGNKLMQLLATIYGIYLMYDYNYKDNKILFMIGLLATLGDGYLFLFESNKYCCQV